ncbi:Phytanoyl-CoA dioxygenase [Pedobacter sp. BAL39]|uniref:phytanoyl-CoA dioxygenase family protein n=1 Tax=Pedobacter sp. BAL39 TaxID=391596 RepID=UPI0001559B94|nr:phytanoyl-CoA dioxygenase family protein [Pedobacter sp. BAL39]EDM38345.1 Phytanoyl-CoA dioxygenase [Pedobacter sp. BAL39]
MNNTFDYQQSQLVVFEETIYEHGWVIFENALGADFVEEINEALTPAYEKRRAIQILNGISNHMDGTLHHLVEPDNFALKFLEQQCCDQQIRQQLGGQYIINSLGAVINVKDINPYVQNVHRDIRSFTGNMKLMVMMLVALDDFTIDNGATYFLSGSHHHEEKPDDEYFYAHADRALAKKGSVILFDANLWHAAGRNHTDLPRRALTMAFTRPFLKQQLDYPRFLGYEYGEELSGVLRQVLGYNARIPADLQEYYQPVPKRMYQPGQG